MTTPSGSSRPKRRRTSPQNTTAASTRRKRVRGSTVNQPATEDRNNSTNNNNASTNDPSAQSEVNSTNNSQPTPIPTSTPTSSGGNLPEPLSAILARYKAWRKKGSPHERRCFECHQEASPTSSLEPCDTCPRVYHESCMPEGSAFSSSPSEGGEEQDVRSRRWYCPVCVNRGWHITPPVLTPPESPVLGAMGSTRAIASPVREGAGAVRSQTTEVTTSTNNRHGNQQTETSTEKEKPDGTRRRSRFDTLSPQVESALWVLYRELESVPLAQRRIANLESEIAQLQQEVRIQRNEIELTRASGPQVRLLREEVERLKAELASRETAAEEVEALKARVRELEGDLERSRDEVAEGARGLAEWKKKLSSLIGD